MKYIIYITFLFITSFSYTQTTIKFNEEFNDTLINGYELQTLSTNNVWCTLLTLNKCITSSNCSYDAKYNEKYTNVYRVILYYNVNYIISDVFTIKNNINSIVLLNNIYHNFKLNSYIYFENAKIEFHN